MTSHLDTTLRHIMQKSTAIFSICSNNYLAQAEVFFATVGHHLPEADLFLGLADEPRDEFATPPGVCVIRADALGIPDFDRIAFGYDIMEFNTAIKPAMFLRLFERGYRQVLYFDPDIMLFSRLEGIFAALAQGASFVLTPHLCSPPDVDAPRTEIDVMRTGVFNLGFLACSASAETQSVLRWWARKLLHECINDQTRGLFVDQKFMDLVPGFTDHAVILRDPAMNIAYWNLSKRHVERSGQGWTVDGRPLGFFHFSGFDPINPKRLSKHVPFASLPDAVLDLLAHYAALFLSRPHRADAPYAYANFASGTPIPGIVRKMYRDHEPTWFGNPFETYEAYLRRPSPHATVGRSGETVTTLMEHVHHRSADLRHRFNLRNRHHVILYLQWFREYAAEHDVPATLM